MDVSNWLFPSHQSWVVVYLGEDRGPHWLDLNVGGREDGLELVGL